MRIGYKTFFQGAAWSITTLICMASVVHDNYWFALLFGAFALISMWCGLSNADKLP